MKKGGKWEVFLTQDKPHAGETAIKAMGGFIAVLTRLSSGLPQLGYLAE